MFKRQLAVVFALFASFSVFAAEKPADAIAFLVKKMGGTAIQLKGHTPEMFYDCGVDFVADEGRLLATFYHPQGKFQDIRSVFEIKAKTRVKLLDAKNAVVLVENAYVEKEDGRAKKSIYRAQMEVVLDGSGKVASVNLGWNRDRQAPLMYRCVMN